MAFKIVLLLATLAYANAGLIAGPAVAAYSPAAAVSSSYVHQAAAPVHAYAAAPVATYAHAAPVATYAHAAPVATYAHAGPVAVHAPHYGATSQSVVRSLGGNQAVSHYSKAVDSAFSSVRKYDTRITNDALSYAHAPVATYAHAPVATYAHAPVATYAQAPVATYASAPVVAKAAYAGPIATYAHAPVASYAHAPVAKAAIAYSPAAVVSHVTYDAPTLHYGW